MSITRNTGREFDYYLGILRDVYILGRNQGLKIKTKHGKDVIDVSDLFKILHDTLHRYNRININNLQVFLRNVSTQVTGPPIYGYVVGIYAIKISFEFLKMDVTLENLTMVVPAIFSMNFHGLLYTMFFDNFISRYFSDIDSEKLFEIFNKLTIPIEILNDDSDF